MSLSEAVTQRQKSELPHISIEVISPELRVWLNDTYEGLEVEKVSHDWTDIDDWNRHVDGTSINTYYPIPDSLDSSTWAKISTYRFKNTGYHDENYFYAPIALVTPNADG